MCPALAVLYPCDLCLADAVVLGERELRRRVRVGMDHDLESGVDDLALMGEGDFLEVLQAISVLGKNVKNALKHCLDTSPDFKGVPVEAHFNGWPAKRVRAVPRRRDLRLSAST